MNFASRIGRMLREGDTVLLSGDLGAGKSVVARGVARALGVAGPMPSPTFTLMIPYQGEKRVYHFDLYRLSGPDEFYAAGLDEWFGGTGVCLVEWPETVELSLRPCLRAAIRRVENEEERFIVLETDGVSLDAAALSQWRMDA